jgi:glycosyltransferase involved in cell wall biosynthesis
MSCERVAIAMSVYQSDDPDRLRSALDSLIVQSYNNLDIFLQIDGEVPDKTMDVIHSFTHNRHFHCEQYPRNMGLAFQLNRVIAKIVDSNQYQYIARMDADDICDPIRIEEQVQFFKLHPEVAVLGTGVTEFYNDGSEMVKRMPSAHEQLAKNIIKRCPFNHPTVMFNLQLLSKNDLQYDSRLQNTQDYYLWVDLLHKGYQFSNISHPLLRFRVDEHFHARRGLNKAKNDFLSRVYAMRKLRCYSVSNVVHTCLLFLLRVSPQWAKKMAYRKLR